MGTPCTKIALDIETVPNERANEWWETVEVSAPKNYKDQEKIDAYIKEKRAGLYEKSALYWHTNKLFSFAVVEIDGDKETFRYSLDEKELLMELAESCQGKIVYTKDGKLFDFPVILMRCIANKITPPSFLEENSGRAKDICELISRSVSNSQRQMTLDAYAFGMGMAGKDGDVSIVSNVYNQMITNNLDIADLEQLRGYNLQDARIVAEFVRRYYGN